MKKITLIACVASFALFLAGCDQPQKPIESPSNNSTGSTTQEVTYNADSWKTIIDPSCKNFFDGCNRCMKSGTGENDMAACTKMACEKYEKPVCLDSDDTTDQNTHESEETYIGLTIQEATDKAKNENTFFRIVNIDGEPQAITADYRPGRLNASVFSGKVTAITVEGSELQE